MLEILTENILQKILYKVLLINLQKSYVRNIN